MPLRLKHFFLLLLTGVLLCSFSDSFSQSKKRKRTMSDSLRNSIVRRDSLMRTLKRSDTSLNLLLQKVEYYSNSFDQISVTLSHGFDTTEISTQLPGYQRRIALVKTLIDKDKSGTLRYLYAIRDILTRSEDQLGDWQSQLADNNSKLVQMRTDLGEIKKDATFNTIPADSALQQTSAKPIKSILSKHHMLDSANKVALLKIGLLQNRVADVYIGILDQKDQINTKIRTFSERALSTENDYIWAMKPSPGTTFTSAFADTFNMNFKLLRFMVNRDTLIHFLGFFILISFFAWIYSNLRKILNSKSDPRQILEQTNYAALHPYLSAIIVSTVLQPYFYDHPAAVFLEVIFLVTVSSVLLMVKETFPKPLYLFLRYIYWITILLAVSNLFVEVSNADRLVLLFLSAISAILAYRFLNTNKDVTTYPPYWRLVLKVFTVLQGISFLCNVMGRFSLAKIIAVTATFNLWLGLSLFLFVQILMQSLFLQLEANKGDSVISSYLDFKVLQRKFRNILNTIALVLWVIMLAQNLSIEDLMYDGISDFLKNPHSLGGTLFSFGSILIFIVVIWLASVTSRIISYFYDFASQHKEESQGKRKNKTSMLLIRISIFAVGFFLAVAASGFPLDKITIIISAFGVGIGFGLQNIVNNLVSGLILAFEKPVQIGDIIEVAGRSGSIQEIGIRSSKILTGDGAEIIIPNGDLISQHVINWTLSNNNRRVELIIGVAYGSNIEQVKTILKNLLADRDDIMTNPAPVVLLHNLNESSVDFRLLFWAADIALWQELKSRILAEVYTTFNEEGINLPFPQRDVHLYWNKDAVNPLSPKTQPKEGIIADTKPAEVNDTAATPANKTDEGPGQ